MLSGFFRWCRISSIHSLLSVSMGSRSLNQLNTPTKWDGLNLEIGSDKMDIVGSLLDA